jgi:hypothetical protein
MCDSRGDIDTAIDDYYEDADFDELLEASSLGAPVVKAIQKLTPASERARMRELRLREQLLHEHLEEEQDQADQAAGRADVDDVLLIILLRATALTSTGLSAPDRCSAARRLLWLSSPPSRHVHESAHRCGSVEWNLKETKPVGLHFATHAHPREARDAVQVLLERNTFSYLGRDAARRLVTFGFAWRHTDTLVVDACQTAMPVTGFGEELAEQMTMLWWRFPKRSPRGKNCLRAPGEENSNRPAVTLPPGRGEFCLPPKGRPPLSFRRWKQPKRRGDTCRLDRKEDDEPDAGAGIIA